MPLGNRTRRAQTGSGASQGPRDAGQDAARQDLGRARRRRPRRGLVAAAHRPPPAARPVRRPGAGGPGRARADRAATPNSRSPPPTTPCPAAPAGRRPASSPGPRFTPGCATVRAEHGIAFFDLGEDGQGIVHVMGPELGIVLPGVTLICGDSHTCTNGGLGALAFGVGSSELTHALATQTFASAARSACACGSRARCGTGVGPKDMILHLIGRLGANAGTGYAVEYAGAAVRALPVEGRLTLCNLSIEMGAKMGLIAPDDTDFRVSRRPPLRAERRRVRPGGAGLATLADRRRRRVRPRGGRGRGGGGADRDLGNQPRARHRHRRHHPRPGRHRGPGAAGSPARRARLHGAGAGAANRRDSDQLGVHRVLHQQPPV